jgi:hypothetical protein
VDAPKNSGIQLQNAMNRLLHFTGNKAAVDEILSACEASQIQFSTRPNPFPPGTITAWLPSFDIDLSAGKVVVTALATIIVTWIRSKRHQTVTVQIPREDGRLDTITVTGHDLNSTITLLEKASGLIAVDQPPLKIEAKKAKK